MNDQDQPSMTFHIGLLVLFAVLFAAVCWWLFSEHTLANWCNMHAEELGSKLKCARYYQ